jgi:IS4 transposase
VKIYKKRWPIEKMFRTIKQHLSLQECQSTKMEIQLNHAAAFLLSYWNVVVLQKKKKFKTPEESLRGAKLKKILFFELCNSSNKSIE